VLADVADGVSPPMISSPPAAGNSTSRDTAAGSWYGAGMTWSVIAVPGARLCAYACRAGVSGCEPVHDSKQQAASASAAAMATCRRANIRTSHVRHYPSDLPGAALP